MNATTPLALRSIDRRSIWAQAGLVVGGAALTAIAAQISIPFEPVPFTLQTLAVLLCGAALGFRLGALSQATYVLAGLCGAPVFAQAKFGPAALFGPTGGYLVAFVFAAGLVGLLVEKGWNRSIFGAAAIFLAGEAIILLVGAGWLSVWLRDAKQAIALGVVPFLLSDALKVGLLTAGFRLDAKLGAK